jgi:phage terminase small subunit
MAGIKGKSGGPRANSGGARQNSGGARPGAGRKQGTKNPRTIARAEAARLLPFCACPLGWLLALMRDDRQDLRLRVDAARALMPFHHVRL